MVYPILKWAGGKRKRIPDIIDIFPADYKERKYHEPFIGSGAVFFHISPKSGSINDIITRLITFYNVVRDKPEDLISQAQEYPHDKDVFYKLRDHFNQGKLTDVEEAALLLYFNKTAFNGLYRVNSKGGFNVPFGNYKNPTIVPKDRIRAASQVLKSVDIFNKDFSYVVEYSESGDLCYFDPPYAPLSDTAYFTSYSVKGFNFQEQIRLRDVCVELDKKGVFFILSNSYIDPIIAIYQEIDTFKLFVVQAKRAISSKASTRGPINEILVTNIPQHMSQNPENLQRLLEN